MLITGEMLIGRQAIRGSGEPIRALSPITGKEIDEPVFGSGSVKDTAVACELAKNSV